MALNLSSHVIQTNEAGSSLSQVDPYVRLSNGSLTLFIQNGTVYSEDGKRMKEANLPEWWDEELEKLSPEARKAIGLDREPSPGAEAEPPLINQSSAQAGTDPSASRKQVSTRKK